VLTGIAGYASCAWCGEDGYQSELYWGEAIFGSGFWVQEGGVGDSHLRVE